MTSTPAQRPIILLGPTAGGKSALAVALAQQLNGAVIGADSMQVYRHLDAGTAKPTPAQRAAVAHHLIDVVEPTEPFTVHDWLTRTQTTLDELAAAGKRAIVVGGTNLYLKALLEGLFDGPPADPTLRAELDQLSPGELHDRLKTVDPPAAARIHPNDRKRLTRALEVYQLTGKPISVHQQQWDDTGLAGGDSSDVGRFLMIGLSWPVELINQRINLRVKAMFYPDRVDPQLAAEICLNGESLPAEVARLEAAGLLGTQARQALGYQQVIQHLQGLMTLDDAFERTKILTRRFAKTQRTWLRRFAGVKWLPGEQLSDAAKVEAALSFVNAD